MQRLYDRWILLALTLFSLGVVSALIVGGVPVTYDDGFYYFKIAQHVARGLGSTFDGIHPTNGYHPLWLLLLVPIFWSAPATHTALTLGTIAQGILWAISAGLLYSTARLICGRAASTLATLFWIAFTYTIALGGLEFSLQALCMLAAAYAYARWFVFQSPQTLGHYLALGSLLSLTFLARVDTILLAGAVGLFLVGRELRGRLSRDSMKRLVVFGMPITVTVLAYSGINLWLFGHALPVSSVIKRDWSSYLLMHDPLYRTHGWLAAKSNQLFSLLRDIRRTYPVVLGTLGMICLWVVWVLDYRHVRQRAWFRKTILLLSPFALFSTVQILSFAVLYHGGLSYAPWYFVIQPWLTALLAGALFEGSLRLRESAQLAQPSMMSSRWLIPLLFIIVWCSVPVRILRGVKLRIDDQRIGLPLDPLRESAKWVSANLPGDAVIGTWNAGTIGYLSERTVVNLDGVVNSWDYCLVERYDLCAYWRRAGITYLVDVFENGQALSVVPTHVNYSACADDLQLIWSDQRYGKPWKIEVYRLKPGKD